MGQLHWHDGCWGSGESGDAARGDKCLIGVSLIAANSRSQQINTRAAQRIEERISTGKAREKLVMAFNS
jgi:hypothetical protein